MAKITVKHITKKTRTKDIAQTMRLEKVEDGRLFFRALKGDGTFEMPVEKGAAYVTGERYDLIKTD